MNKNKEISEPARDRRKNKLAFVVLGAVLALLAIALTVDFQNKARAVDAGGHNNYLQSLSLSSTNFNGAITNTFVWLGDGNTNNNISAIGAGAAAGSGPLVSANIFLLNFSAQAWSSANVVGFVSFKGCIDGTTNTLSPSAIYRVDINSGVTGTSGFFNNFTNGALGGWNELVPYQIGFTNAVTNPVVTVHVKTGL